MARPKPLLVIAVVAVAVVGAVGFFLVRPTPLDEAVAALEERDYFFEEDRDADPGLSSGTATAVAAPGGQPSLGPVAGFLTHDGRPTRRNDLKDQAVYLFVVDELHDPGPIISGGPPAPARHAVFVYAQGGAHSVIAIPIGD